MVAGDARGPGTPYTLEAPVAQFDFTYEFQRDVLRLLAHDPQFLLGHRKAIDAEYFSDRELQLIAEAMLGIFDEAQGSPSLGTVLEEVEERAQSDDDTDEVQDVARGIYQEGMPHDGGAIADRVVTFGKRCRLEQALLDAPDLIERGEFNSVEEVVREAITVQADAESNVYDYYEFLERRLAGAQTRAAEAIPTGIVVIDNHLPDGGLARGEMGLLIGLPGYGKSTSLVNIGVGALTFGKKVFHATVGDMSERAVGNRYDSCITQKTVLHNRTHAESCMRDVGTFLESTGGHDRLIIKYWPSNRVTIPDMERYLRWLEASRGWKPDVVVVDYCANMAPRKQYDGKMIRLAHEEVYKDFRALGSVMGFAGWSAIQANREAFNLDAPGMGQAAEAFGPMRDCDLAIGIGTSAQMRDDGYIRFKCAKMRDSEAEWDEVCGVDFKTHRIYERDDFGDEDDDDDDFDDE
jgi:replicative DNA helicase